MTFPSHRILKRSSLTQKNNPERFKIGNRETHKFYKPITLEYIFEYNRLLYIFKEISYFLSNR